VCVPIWMDTLFPGSNSRPGYQRKFHGLCMFGPVLLVIVGLIALLIETGHLNPFHLLHWYIRWWPFLLIGAGLLALGEWWFDRNNNNPHYCSNGAWIAFFICCLALLVSPHGSFGIYVSGHLVNGEDLARLLTQE
jgi:hypothetical membrane protein